MNNPAIDEDKELGKLHQAAAICDERGQGLAASIIDMDKTINAIGELITDDLLSAGGEFYSLGSKIKALLDNHNG